MLRRLLTGISAAVLAGCSTPAALAPRAPAPPDVREWVSADAAATLDAHGRFIFPEPAAPGGEPIITRQRAGDLALASVRTWIDNPRVVILPGGGSIRKRLERYHGAPIAWEKVQLEERKAYYAESPYEPLPDSIPAAVRITFGPHFLVPLYVGDLQVAVTTVAAYSTEVAIGEDGRIRLPQHLGNVFFDDPVPKTLQVRIPLWPEEAVRIVGQATGTRVIERPVLLQPAKPVAAFGARWKLVLDRPIRVQSEETGEMHATREIFLRVWDVEREDGQPALGVVWYRAHAEQPMTEEHRYPLWRGVRTLSPEIRPLTVQLRPDVPVLFERVAPVP